LPDLFFVIEVYAQYCNVIALEGHLEVVDRNRPISSQHQSFIHFMTDTGTLRKNGFASASCEVVSESVTLDTTQGHGLTISSAP
jgi:hypothetical protein